MSTMPTVELGIGNELVHPGWHIAFLWETDEEFREAVGFLTAGVTSGDQLVIFGHDEANRRVLDMLRRQGIDVVELRASGRLDVLGPAETGEETLELIGATCRAAIERGSPLVRLLGNIGWGHVGWPSHLELLELEAQIGRVLPVPCVALCMYDVKSLSCEVLIHRCFETHPVTIFGKLVRSNPFYRSLEHPGREANDSTQPHPSTARVWRSIQPSSDAS